MAPTTNDQNFERDVINASQPVLVDCWAPWCAPCRNLAPIIDQLHQVTKGYAHVFKLNVDENPVTSATYGIRSVPTVLVFIDGQETARLVGLQHPEKYLQALGLEIA